MVARPVTPPPSILLGMRNPVHPIAEIMIATVIMMWLLTSCQIIDLFIYFIFLSIDNRQRSTDFVHNIFVNRQQSTVNRLCPQYFCQQTLYTIIRAYWIRPFLFKGVIFYSSLSALGIGAASFLSGACGAKKDIAESPTACRNAHINEQLTIYN